MDPSRPRWRIVAVADNPHLSEHMLPLEERASLRPGDTAHITMAWGAAPFEDGAGGGASVTVLDTLVDDECYLGEFVLVPGRQQEVTPGDRVVFGPEHVHAFYRVRAPLAVN